MVSEPRFTNTKSSMPDTNGITQYHEIRYTITYYLMGMSLDHAFIVHSDELLCAIYCMILCYIVCKLYTW